MNVKPGDFAKTINDPMIDYLAGNLVVLVLQKADVTIPRVALMTQVHGYIWEAENIDRLLKLESRVCKVGESFYAADKILRRIDPPKEVEDVNETTEISA